MNRSSIKRKKNEKERGSNATAAHTRPAMVSHVKIMLVDAVWLPLHTLPYIGACDQDNGNYTGLETCYILTRLPKQETYIDTKRDMYA